MKCTKIVLESRSEKGNKSVENSKNEETLWITTGYHGYSYKLSARTKHRSAPKRLTDPQLTITTLIFPENKSFNTGSSLERWSRKAPRLITAKCKNYTPRQRILDEDLEYNFSYPIEDVFNDDNEPHKVDDNDPYYVQSDIQELILKSHPIQDHEDKNNNNKHKKSRETTAKKKRNKLKKTIRFSISRPASPETEQVIRVDVTSNVSIEESSSLLNNLNAKTKNLSPRRCDNDKKPSTNKERVEEDFIIKCRQLALTQKKR